MVLDGFRPMALGITDPSITNRLLVTEYLAHVVGDPRARRGRHVAAAERVRCDQHAQPFPGEQRNRFATRRERHRDMDGVEGVQRTHRPLRIPIQPRPGPPELERVLQRELAVRGVDRLAEPGIMSLKSVRSLAFR